LIDKRFILPRQLFMDRGDVALANGLRKSALANYAPSVIFGIV